MDMSQYPANFLAVLEFTLHEECPHPEDWSNHKNFSNDEHDTGGKTMCGIIQREYNAYRIRLKLPVRDVREMTREEGTEIYYWQYWQPHCGRLACGANAQLFDANVNMGVGEGATLLQRALRLVQPDLVADGHIGMASGNAINDLNASNSDVVANVIVEFGRVRLAAYRQMKAFRYFGNNWTGRAKRATEFSLKLLHAQNMGKVADNAP